MLQYEEWKFEFFTKRKYPYLFSNLVFNNFIFKEDNVEIKNKKQVIFIESAWLNKITIR